MYESIKEYLKVEKIKYEIAELSNYSTVKIGGRSLIVFPDNENDLIKVSDYLYKNKIKHRVLGAMSNTLALSSGYEGVAVITRNFNSFSIDGNLITASAGMKLSKAQSALMEHNLTGFEELVGIPGLIGGLVYENAGAFSKTVSDIFVNARMYNKKTSEITKLKKSDMCFGYRHSILSENSDLVLLSACFRLEYCENSILIGNKLRDLGKRRREAQPLEYPSLGSVFKRPAFGFAGAYIEDAGLKGFRSGDALISEKHAGFIVNIGKATSDDFIDVMNKAESVVFKKYGIKLEREVEILQ